jgi:hypothetical protein
MPPIDSVTREESLDLLWGVDSIAAFLKIKPAKAYYLIARGKLPVRKHGHRTISALRSELRRAVTAETA